MKAGDLYVGEAGEEYFEQRAQYRSPDAQKRRAGYFSDFTKMQDVALDFGCGTGGVLSHLDAARRIGVEISEQASFMAQGVLDEVFNDISLVDTQTVDRIISFHALEHVDSPSHILREFHRVLKDEGAVRILVPCEMPFVARSHLHWQSNAEMHLYSWTPLTLGNLLAVSGFDVVDAHVIPGSGAGRIGALVSETSLLGRTASFVKSLRTGKFHTAVTAQKK